MGGTGVDGTDGAGAGAVNEFAPGNPFSGC